MQPHSHIIRNAAFEACNHLESDASHALCYGTVLKSLSSFSTPAPAPPVLQLFSVSFPFKPTSGIFCNLTTNHTTQTVRSTGVGNNAYVLLRLKDYNLPGSASVFNFQLPTATGICEINLSMTTILSSGTTGNNTVFSGEAYGTCTPGSALGIHYVLQSHYNTGSKLPPSDPSYYPTTYGRLNFQIVNGPALLSMVGAPWPA